MIDCGQRKIAIHLEGTRMMSIDALRDYGANTAEGLARCMNNEAFYIRMVGMALEDKNFEALKAGMAAGDAHAAFEAAHALKGSMGNVALTPIYKPMCELTELLRGKSGEIDGGGKLLDEIVTQWERAKAL